MSESWLCLGPRAAKSLIKTLYAAQVDAGAPLSVASPFSVLNYLCAPIPKVIEHHVAQVDVAVPLQAPHVAGAAAEAALPLHARLLQVGALLSGPALCLPLSTDS